MANGIIWGPSPVNGDDTYSLQGWLDSLPDNARCALYPSVFHVYRPLTCVGKRLQLDARGAVLQWRGTAGTVLTLGFPPSSPIAPGSNGYGWTVEGLTIQHTGLGESIYLNSSSGLTIQNVYGGWFGGINISGFGTGINAIGDGTGNTSNTLWIRNLSNNGVSYNAATLNGGYVTEWGIHGGNWQYSAVAAGSTPTHAVLTGPNVGAIRFTDCCFQGLPGVIWANLSNCNHVIFSNCRYEKSDETTANITLQTTALSCALVGVTSPGVVWNDLSGGVNGHVYLPNWH